MFCVYIYPTHSTLFYCILFYSTLFYSILLYSILHSILDLRFSCIPVYSILFYSIPFHCCYDSNSNSKSHSILSCFTSSHPILCPILYPILCPILYPILYPILPFHSILFYSGGNAPTSGSSLRPPPQAMRRPGTERGMNTGGQPANILWSHIPNIVSDPSITQLEFCRPPRYDPSFQ